MKSKKSALFIATILFAMQANIHAATLTWVGDVDANWSTDSGPGDTNWDTDTLPTNTDIARFNDVTSGTLNTTVDAATTIQFLNFQQSTTTATNAISLGADLTLTSNNGTGSGITYASTISNSAMIKWDINGNYLRFSSTSVDTKVNNLYGTFTLDTTGSRIGTARTPGTGASDTDTFNFGNGSNLAVVNVTANSQIGRITTGTTNSNALRLTTINVGAGSEVNVANNATLDFLQRTRVSTNNTNTLAVNNSGTVDIADGSRLQFTYEAVNIGNQIVNTSFNNLSGATMNLLGTLDARIHGSGTAAITNAGTWNVGGDVVINGVQLRNNNDALATVRFTNQSGGVLTGSTSNATINYDPNHATRINQTLTLTNEGILSPGLGHNGSGLTSVGSLSLTDIDATFSGSSATLRLDIGGTAAGQYDQLTLTNGALTLDGDSKLELNYVNGFNGSEGNSWTILNYGSRSGSFNLATNLIINGATGFAANPANYSITYGANSATLTLSPSGMSAYDSWADGFGLSGANAAFDFDFDNDGLDNGLEWIFGGSPILNDAASVAPVVTGSATTGLTLVFNRNPDSIAETTLLVEWGTNFPLTNTLTIGTTDVGPSGDNPTIDIDAPAAGKVTVNIPAANAVGGKLFARVKATQNL